MDSKNLQLLVCLLLWLPVAHAQNIHNGEDVLKAMHDRYATTWYTTLTFTQKSTTYNADGTSKSDIWHEAAGLPAKLRIDIGNPTDENGYLLVDGVVTVIKAGKEVGTRPQINMLLVLGFDVYEQPAEATIKVVKGEGYDLSKLHEDTWEGQPVYVVGADKGDLKSKQFWIDKNRLLFMRVLEPTQTDTTKFQDIRFEDYREMSGGWVAARVEVYAEEKKVFSEDYTEIVCNAKLDPGTFDPKQFSATHWEKP